MSKALTRLDMPGRPTVIGWKLPDNLSKEEWLECGKALVRIEAGVQWNLGDWWAYASDRQYGDGEELAEKVGKKYQDLLDYGCVSKAFPQFSDRTENLTFTHHRVVMAVEPNKRQQWLAKAERKGWSVSQLRAAILQARAIERTNAVEFDAQALGKFALIYADPPWKYEFPPMGGANRSVENHYPTMTLDEISALPVDDIAHDNCVLFLWATAPLLDKTIGIINAWGFQYRTNAVWVKDRIGTGYHFRNRHELLLVAKKGELPPPPVEARHDSVVEAPRRSHSEKPVIYYDIIDLMYPDLSKIELFARNKRRGWKSWGNQVGAITIPRDDDFIVEEAAE